MSSHLKTSRSNFIYSLHPGYAMKAASLLNLKERTGKTLEDWIKIVKKSGLETEKERREWLKSKHGLTTNYAHWIVEHAEGKGGAENYNPEALVEAMFAGKKAALRPIYEALLKLAFRLGKEVKACPGTTIVPLYRRHVFAQLKPSTLTRIDLGLALRDTPAQGRLLDTGGFAKKDRITHRIPISSGDEIDDEVKRWLKAAYDLDA